MKNYDAVVIGAGPGGYVAAIRLAQLGKKVAIVEREHLGGVCLNWGCIPTKALLKASEVYHAVQKASKYGIDVKINGFDFDAVIKRSRDVASKLSGGINHLLKKNKVDVIYGTATLEGAGKISVVASEGKQKEAQKLQSKNIILATGARPRAIPGLEPDDQFIWDYKSAMVPKKMPKSLLVVGSGAIGIEFASFYHMFGCEVTVVEISDRILPAEDAEISQYALKAFEKRGIKIFTKSTAKILAKRKDSVEVEITTGEAAKQQKLKFERVISAVGITPNTSNIGLDKTKAELDERGFIKTDDKMLTKEPGLYAIGDICAAPWLAHKASHEGIIAAESIAGMKTHAMDKSNIPGCTYCYPQIASIGLTEEKAQQQGYKVKVGRFPFMANGKAIAMGEEDGLIKVIFDEKTGELLGSHMIGAEVTEMISAMAVAKSLETTEEDLMSTIFPHPTLSEMMHEAVLDAYDRAIHI